MVTEIELSKLRDGVFGDIVKALEDKQSVTAIVPLHHETYTLSVTNLQCHRCGLNISNSESVVWRHCECGKPLSRAISVRRNHGLGYGTRQDGSFGKGYVATCFNLRQPVCMECHPIKASDYGRYGGYRRHICSECSRVFFTELRGGTRRYCSDRCLNSARARHQREKRKYIRHVLKCLACGKEIIGTRVDRHYCSAACKQRTYRQRKGIA